MSTPKYLGLHFPAPDQHGSCTIPRKSLLCTHLRFCSPASLVAQLVHEPQPASKILESKYLIPAQILACPEHIPAPWRCAQTVMSTLRSVCPWTPTIECTSGPPCPTRASAWSAAAERLAGAPSVRSQPSAGRSASRPLAALMQVRPSRSLVPEPSPACHAPGGSPLPPKILYCVHITLGAQSLALTSH